MSEPLCKRQKMENIVSTKGYFALHVGKKRTYETTEGVLFVNDYDFKHLSPDTISITIINDTVLPMALPLLYRFPWIRYLELVAFEDESLAADIARMPNLQTLAILGQEPRSNRFFMDLLQSESLSKISFLDPLNMNTLLQAMKAMPSHTVRSLHVMDVHSADDTDSFLVQASAVGVTSLTLPTTFGGSGKVTIFSNKIMHGLESLHCSNKFFTAPHSCTLDPSLSLKELFLDFFDNQTLEVIGKIKTLQRFKGYYSDTCHEMTHLVDLQSLSYLDIRFICNVPKRASEDLNCLPNLTQLHLEFTHGSDMEHFLQVYRQYAELSLTVSGSDDTAESVPEGMVSKLLERVIESNSVVSVNIDNTWYNQDQIIRLFAKPELLLLHLDVHNDKGDARQECAIIQPIGQRNTNLIFTRVPYYYDYNWITIRNLSMRRNWDRLAVLLAFMRANMGNPLKNSILQLMPGIMIFLTPNHTSPH